VDRPGQGALQRAVAWLRGQDQRRVGLVLLILAMIGAAGLILWLERGTTYMSDEWGWINFAGGRSVPDLFQPLNQHLSVSVLILTKIVLSLWGTSGAFLPFKLIEVAGVLVCGGLVYAFARPRVGPLVALAPAMVPMYLGTATVILLQPLIGLQVLYSIAFGLGAMVALDRGSRWGDITASLLVTLSLASFSIGISFLAGVTVAVLLAPDRFRRAYVFLIPTILYGAWRVWAMKFGSAGGPELANVAAVPFYYVDSIATTATALFGLSSLIGPGPGTSLFVEGFRFEQASVAFVFVAIETVFIVVVGRRLSLRRNLTPMLWATLAILLSLWTIQGLVLVAGRTPGEGRYIYPGAIALALLVVEAVRRVRFSPLAIAAVLGLTAVGILGNLPSFNHGRNLIEYLAPRNLAYTGLMDLAGTNANPNFVPALETPVASPAGALSIPTYAYQEISARSGPLGYSPSKILELPEEIRHGSDEVAIVMLQLGLEPDAGVATRDCARVDPSEAGDRVPLPRGGAVLQAGRATPVFLRRFAAEDQVAIGKLTAGQATLLRIPPDNARIPWVLETPAPVPLTVCALAKPGT
jgi:hypothetical protein